MWNFRHSYWWHIKRTVRGFFWAVLILVGQLDEICGVLPVPKTAFPMSTIRQCYKDVALAKACFSCRGKVMEYRSYFFFVCSKQLFDAEWWAHVLIYSDLKLLTVTQQQLNFVCLIHYHQLAYNVQVYGALWCSSWTQCQCVLQSLNKYQNDVNMNTFKTLKSSNSRGILFISILRF